jgi:thioredoxin 1
MRNLLVSLLIATGSAAFAATGPYDESADAKAQIAAALAAAAPAKKPVLVVFGANWCADCKVLDMAFHDGAAAPLIAQHFQVVKVDVGRFDRNTDIAKAYGVPRAPGIPAGAVLDARGRVVYATQAGELADARNMGSTAIHAFFQRVAAGAK